MKNRLNKIFNCLLCLLPVLFFIFSFPVNIAQADGAQGFVDKNPFGNMQVEIPGLKELVAQHPVTCDQAGKCKVPWISVYIAAIYKYAVGVVAVIATVIMMFGGFLWIMAGGNAEQIGNAKAWIGASLAGLTLMMGSYFILYQVNPELTNLKPIEITQIKEMKNENSGCEWIKLELNKNCKDVKAGWINSDGNKCTGEKKGESDACCCPPCPEECEKVGCAFCKECENCFSIDYDGLVSCKNGCQATQTLAGKIRTASQEASKKNINFWITEAWPPSQRHESVCHTNGGCVDINFTNKTIEPSKVKELYTILTSAGLNALYESSNCAPYSALGVNCNSGSEYTNAEHFHVQ